MTAAPVHILPADLAAWLDAHAEAIDANAQHDNHAGEIVPRLARAGLFRVGVAPALGGAGGTTVDAIEAIAAVARLSLASAFVFWGQRTFVEYLLQSDNAALRARWLPPLLAGERAGATGLSNAMKYLSAIEPLQMRAAPLDADATRFALDGALPWITNLRREGFLVAAAFDRHDGAPPAIFAVPHDAPGVTRGDDLDLIALRGSNTAALTLANTELDAGWQIAADTHAFLARARPAFLGLQCGMSIGLARRALESVDTSSPAVRAALADDAAALRRELDALTTRLYEGVTSGAFVAQPAAQFEVRIGLADVVAGAARLDVQAAGGRGYLRSPDAQRGANDTARRSREAAFVPIVTPTLVQLKNQLAQHRRGEAA
ncbi:acyl-CoA dehydrogenase family protein [Paraburkholderia lycopersici]|uniref:Acyl-CoA dehydrogenase n=1 Tax=Paraburkholderia lycopersici TaxID=416944 RepID=A0A1G6PLH1_9BURK|nr:acyl-CoA dehydrogenase family protein [Paraburkholderia lycopersici]SDC81102.1 Acyl-CoA dehydrogenase [Paraburkholderia lycopersici]